MPRKLELVDHIELVRLFTKGLTNKQIREVIGLNSTRSVDYRVTAVYRVLNVHNRVEAIKAVRRLGWLDL